ncbi:6,7-dimethyl-8-ribityllumazine synthase [Phytophthora ramorum]|uniref:6,7-dimethyl-8-ribityllumazine synthase n=1 Tax=Phytophthora ramorum TaxID=164328 RepID=UPI0030B2CE0C|nr:6,7-dimethyl-8-ribityllumazine synthase [Phytophthora ramorum]
MGVKTTTKMKHTEKSEGAPHSQEEGKAASPHGPVLIEQPGVAQSGKLDGTGLRVAIIASRWYEKVVHSLVKECSDELLAKGVADDDLHLVEVAGAFEIPFAAARLVHCKDVSHRPDAVICIGCIVNDATHMCETMSHAVAHGIMELNVKSETPVIFGVLCCDSESQADTCAEKRSCSAGGEGHKCSHGVSWAQSALEMAHLKRCTSAKKAEQCRCVRCASRGDESGKHKASKHESGKHESETLKSHGACRTCGSSAEKCSCKECKCKVCCDSRGQCTSCKSSADNCSCEDCKCRSCSTKRQACRGCGCPPDKCSCTDCNCVSCSSNKEMAGTKMPMSSSEYVTAGKLSSPSSGVKQGGSSECASCGSPDGKCKCGLLH